MDWTHDIWMDIHLHHDFDVRHVTLSNHFKPTKAHSIYGMYDLLNRGCDLSKSNFLLVQSCLVPKFVANEPFMTR